MFSVSLWRVKEDNVVGLLTKYFVPLLELRWRLEPESVRGSIQRAGALDLDLASTALTDLVGMGEKGEQAIVWVRFANDSISAIQGLQEIVSAKKK